MNNIFEIFTTQRTDRITFFSKTHDTQFLQIDKRKWPVVQRKTVKHMTQQFTEEQVQMTISYKIMLKFNRKCKLLNFK